MHASVTQSCRWWSPASAFGELVEKRVQPVLILVSDFQREALFGGLPPLLLLNSGISVFKVMVITSMVF